MKLIKTFGDHVFPGQKKNHIWGHYWEHLTICNTVCRCYYSEDMGGGSVHSHELAALIPSIKSDFASYLCTDNVIS